MTGWLIAIGAAVAAAVAHDLWDMPVGRFFRGTPLGGKPFTDATWNHPATRVLVPAGHRDCHHHWRQRKVAAIRATATVAAGLGAWGWIWHRTATEAVLAAGAVVTAALAARPAAAKVTGWRHHRTYVRPLTAALRRELGAAPERLAIEPDRSAVVMTLPEEFTGSPRDREAITRAITAKVAPELEPDWSGLAGRKPQVAFTRPVPPPAKVTFSDIRALVEAAGMAEVIWGLGRRGDVVSVSVDSESPHTGASMTTGDGKSTMAKNMAAQMLYHGALGVFLDIKLISHMWARGLPNVAYAGTPAEIEAALVWLAAEVGRRNEVALAGADIEGAVHANVGPRILVVAEELNATQNRLKAWWNREMGEKGRSPGSEALDDVMFLGRQVHVNVLQIGQRLSVKATGSGDARENLGTLIFKDPTQAAWKMLCPQHVMPPASGHVGRLQVVTRKAVRETQSPYWTGREAHDFATAGTVAVPPADMPCVTSIGPVPGRPELTSRSPDQGIVTENRPLATGPAGAVTLREAVDAGLWPSLAAARKTSTRPGFPEPVGVRGNANLYAIMDLHARQARQ